MLKLLKLSLSLFFQLACISLALQVHIVYSGHPVPQQIECISTYGNA